MLSFSASVIFSIRVITFQHYRQILDNLNLTNEIIKLINSNSDDWIYPLTYHLDPFKEISIQCSRQLFVSTKIVCECLHAFVRVSVCVCQETHWQLKTKNPNVGLCFQLLDQILITREHRLYVHQELCFLIYFFYGGGGDVLQQGYVS